MNTRQVNVNYKNHELVFQKKSHLKKNSFSFLEITKTKIEEGVP